MKPLTGKTFHEAHNYSAKFEELHPDTQKHLNEVAARLNEQLQLPELRQLLLDYQAMCARLNTELYQNAGDSEEIDIVLHELKKRAHALFPGEPSLQIEEDTSP